MNEQSIVRTACEAFSIGRRVSVAGYSGEWAVAEVIREDSSDGAIVLFVVRSVEPDGPGNPDISLRERFVWLSADPETLTSSANQEPVPGVVTRLERSTDSHGPFKKAIVTGERFPVIAFHDPSWQDFVSNLHSRGFIVDPTIPVRLGIPSDNLPHGSHPLNRVLQQRADNVSVPEPQ
jgi:hypothetical protein